MSIDLHAMKAGVHKRELVKQSYMCVIKDVHMEGQAMFFSVVLVGVGSRGCNS